MKPLFSTVVSLAVLLGLNVRAQTIVQIASTDNVSYFVRSDGSLWSGDRAHAMKKWDEKMKLLMKEIREHPGSKEAHDKFSEEGQHVTSGNFEPTDLIVSNGVTSVALNIQGNTFFTKNDGSLWAMGNNDGGFLGDGTFTTPEHPVQIASGGIISVACGEDFTIFLKKDGSIWGFGNPDDGALGNLDRSERVMRPKQIVEGNVAAIAAGYSHTLFIKRDGTLWGLGNNGYGQLGIGTNVNQTFSPVAIASNVVSVAAAHDHTLFIKSDGSLWAMGLNDWGQIGDCTIDWPYRPEQIVSNGVVAVAAGYSGSLFLKKDGSLWGMGINWGGDYGEGVEFSSKCPTQIFAANTNTASVAGYYYNAQLKTCVSVWGGKFNNTTTEKISAANESTPHSSAETISASKWLSIELLDDGNVRLTFQGEGGKKYALERTSSLANPNWSALSTNTAPSSGMLVITNKPDTTANNFWRIRSAQ